MTGQSPRRQFTTGVGLVAWLMALLGPAFAGHDAPRPEDDRTFRPTVMIRQAGTLGSGTVIASVQDETLILTAAHVIKLPGPILVELFRFNLGLERNGDASGFPRRLLASVVARDVAADLAVIRVRGELAFPFVARLGGGDDPPPPGTHVTTLGYDRGERLIGSATRIRTVERIDLERGGGSRSFLLTDHPPELGRSGGGLFEDDGTLVGVCVGRIEIKDGRPLGLFTGLVNVHALIRSHKGLASAMGRSHDRARAASR